MRPRYAKNAGATFSLRYHTVWCPKYRRKVLVPPVDERLKQLLKEKAQEREIEILSLEIMPDHVHIFASGDPALCVAEIVNRLKGYTSRVLRSEFPFLKTKLPTLWSRSYYAGTVGHVSEATIRKYIEAQKGK